jgi:TPR repeat protein
MPSQLRAESGVSAAHPQTPDEYLQLGIKHHEANRLEESALCFERSAKEQGGCGVGMLMYGLSLRHGWGCPRNEKGGFHWLKKAAELAVTDLEKGKQGADAMAIRVSFFENKI